MNRRILNYKTFMEDNIIQANKSVDLDFLLKVNSSATSNFQAERLVHLIVTMSFALFTLIFISLYLLTSIMFIGILCLITTTVLVFYILHYYKLENNVQGLLDIDQKIIDRKKELERQEIHPTATI